MNGRRHANTMRSADDLMQSYWWWWCVETKHVRKRSEWQANSSCRWRHAHCQQRLQERHACARQEPDAIAARRRRQVRDCRQERDRRQESLVDAVGLVAVWHWEEHVTALPCWRARQRGDRWWSGEPARQNYAQAVNVKIGNTTMEEYITQLNSNDGGIFTLSGSSF